MKSLPIPLLAFAVSALSSCTQDKPENDAELLLGTWEVISLEDDGRKVADGEMPDVKWVIGKEELSVQMGDRTKTSPYTIDPSKSPKWIDLEDDDLVSKAIYELEGERLRICVSEDSKRGRPTAFESEPDSVNDLLFTLRRASGKGDVAPAEAAEPADPADVPQGFESLGLSKDQAAKINDWLEKQGDTVNPADLAKFVKAQLREDQQEAFRKLLETGGG